MKSQGVYSKKEMSGVSQHITYVGLKKGEAKRHCTKCKYHYGKNKGNCSYRSGTCIGSGQCSHYVEVESEREAKKNNYDEYVLPKALKYAKAFTSIEDVRLCDIENLKTVSIDSKEVNRIVEKYKHTKVFDKPVGLGLNKEKYNIVNNFSIYYAAKILGLQKIPAEMGTVEELVERNKLRTVGTVVYFKITKDDGEVVEAGMKYAKIRFDSGKEMTVDVIVAMKNGTLLVL